MNRILELDLAQEQWNLTFETSGACQSSIYAEHTPTLFSTLRKKRGLKSCLRSFFAFVFLLALGWSNLSLMAFSAAHAADLSHQPNPGYFTNPVFQPLCPNPLPAGMLPLNFLTMSNPPDPWTFQPFASGDAALDALKQSVKQCFQQPYTVCTLQNIRTVTYFRDPPQTAGISKGWIQISSGYVVADSFCFGESRTVGIVYEIAWYCNNQLGDCGQQKKYTIKLSRQNGLPAESGTVLYSSEPGQLPQMTPELVATVYDEHNQVVPGVAVRLQVNAVPNTGGHQHGDNTVPLRTGALSSNDSSATLSQNGQVLTGNTGSTGFVLSYSAPPAAGDITITATCTDSHHCTQEGPTQVWVGIKDLQPLGLNVYILIPNASKDPGHPNNHYLTPIAAGVVAVFANLYHAAYSDNSLLQLNDASLERGGIFDLSHNWKSPHEQHCRGTVVDIRANGVDGALNITSDTDPMIYRVQKIGNKVGAIPVFEVPPDVAGVPVWDARHFHTLLIGLEGRQCP